MNPIICIFVYRREIKNLIMSLKDNRESADAEVWIFSDGSKDDFDRDDIANVRRYINELDGFGSVKLFLSQENKGLARSIIDGVDLAFRYSDRVIVLEDDLIVSPYFLSYMYEALKFHQKDQLIWSISGYTPSLPVLKELKADTILSVRSSSWGWATWKDRWEKTDWDVSDFETFCSQPEQIRQFNLGGNDMFRMLELQMLGEIDSWAIRWCYQQFRFGAYSVLPRVSLVSNQGFLDGKGTHNQSGAEKWAVTPYHHPLVVDEVHADECIITALKQHYDIGFVTRLGYFLRKYGGYSIGKRLLLNFRKLNLFF